MSSSSMHPVRGEGRPKRGARKKLHPNRADGRSAYRDAAGGIEGVEGQ